VVDAFVVVEFEKGACEVVELAVCAAAVPEEVRETDAEEEVAAEAEEEAATEEEADDEVEVEAADDD